MYGRVVVFLDARVEADLARAIAQLVRQVVDALSVVLVVHVQVAVVLHRTVLPAHTRAQRSSSAITTRCLKNTPIFSYDGSSTNVDRFL